MSDPHLSSPNDSTDSELTPTDTKDKVANGKPPLKNRPVIEPGLYVVATPIGNAEDLSFRAHRLLTEADVVACEDTRVAQKLCARHDLRPNLIAYHDHNAAKIRPRLLNRLGLGEVVVLISDAGTPLVSDPGYKLVREALAAGANVVPVPGPSAPLAALAVAGLPTDRFMFAGFLPPKGSARRSVLRDVATVPATLVFFESAKRLASSLTDMEMELGDRQAAVARELTKRFEEFRRGRLSELSAHYTQAGAPKGEITVVIGPPGEKPEPNQETLDEALRQELANHGTRQAAAVVAARYGLSKRDLYQRALSLGNADRD